MIEIEVGDSNLEEGEKTDKLLVKKDVITDAKALLADQEKSEERGKKLLEAFDDWYVPNLYELMFSEFLCLYVWKFQYNILLKNLKSKLPFKVRIISCDFWGDNFEQ